MKVIEPLQETANARTGIGEGTPATLSGSRVLKETDLQGSLGDIDAQTVFEKVSSCGLEHVSLVVAWDG
jgi:hypothetical protein